VATRFYVDALYGQKSGTDGVSDAANHAVTNLRESRWPVKQGEAKGGDAQIWPFDQHEDSVRNRCNSPVGGHGHWNGVVICNRNDQEHATAQDCVCVSTQTLTLRKSTTSIQ
jgi:hypothetical protein